MPRKSSSPRLAFWVRAIGRACAIAVLLSAPLSANIIYSTDGTTAPVFDGANWDAVNSGSDNSFAVLMRFAATATGTADTLVVAGFEQPGDPFTETFDLFLDVDGTRSSTLLDQFFIKGPSLNQPELLTAPSTARAAINEGQYYWLVALAPVDGNNYFRWNYSETVGIGCEVPVAGNQPRFGNNQCALAPPVTVGAFALVGNSEVPEPGSISLAVIGALVMGIAFRVGIVHALNGC